MQNSVFYGRHAASNSPDGPPVVYPREEKIGRFKKSRV